MTTQPSTAAALAAAHDASEHARQTRNYAACVSRVIRLAADGMSTAPAEGEHIATAAGQLAALAESLAETAITYANAAAVYPSDAGQYIHRTTRIERRAAHLRDATRQLARAAESFYLAAGWIQA